MFDLKKYTVTEIYSLFFQNLCQGIINKDLCLGVFYMTIHIIYVLLIIYNAFFTYNLINTVILLIIIYLNSITVYLLKTCPLTLLEKKYINTTCLKTIFFDNYKEKKEKEKEKEENNGLSKYLDYKLDDTTLEGLFTLGIFLSIKILIIIIK